MTLIEWKEIYSLGNVALDHEHKTLIDLINKVHEDIVASGQAVDVERLAMGLGEISTSVSAHFALEEKEMQLTKYHNFAAHKADHEKLLDEIADIAEAVEEGLFGDFGERLSVVLSDWFSIHFQTFDREFHGSVDQQN